MSRPTVAAALAALAACAPAPEGEGVVDDALQAPSPTPAVSAERRRPSRADDAASCVAEPSAPAAAGKVVMALDATGQPVASVHLVNTTRRTLALGARLRTQVGGLPRTVETPAQPVRPGASVQQQVALRALGIDPGGVLPTRIEGSVLAHEEDGRLVGRAPLEAAEVGPSPDQALDGLLRGRRLKARRVVDPGVPGVKAALVALDRGDAGLWLDQLDDPDDEGGLPTPEPNYSSAVPDDEGLYHYRFCMRWPVSWSDAGFGEDYGTQPEAAWKARGGKTRILSHDEVLFDGWLDLDGCTPVIDTPYHTDFWLIGSSMARLGTNTIIARRDDGKTEGSLRLVDEVGGSGTKYYTFAPGSLTNLIAAPAFTLARIGSVEDQTFTVHDRCRTAQEGKACCNCASADQIWIDSTSLKFLIAHEMGHVILSSNTSYLNDCSVTVSDTLPCYTASEHAIDSLETQSCAAMEGWAHFVAVRAFNDHQESDNPGAVLQYWRDAGLTVDVEQGPVGGVDTYFEATCGLTPSQQPGFGVELDWLRTWWDYHTNPSPGVRPSVGLMIDELASDSTWTPSDTYTVIRDGIDAASGDTQRARWVQMATWNGIDH
ncbi:MAG: hypothetical protein H6732_10335 [Alphaproteobacteria bacterium]|nr:hypothetical protein [Alphaproteobacteria bacterium]